MPSSSQSSLDSSQSRRANFQSRAATDHMGELSRRTSVVHEEEEEDTTAAGSENPYEPATNASTPPPRKHSFANRLGLHPDDETSRLRRRSTSGKRRSQSAATSQELLSSVQLHNEAESKKANGDPTAPKAGLGPRPIGGSEKLGMFSGVYVPTCLNVLSILMFLRFGFILGSSTKYHLIIFVANFPQVREVFLESWEC